jgi:hypothetical protein
MTQLGFHDWFRLAVPGIALTGIVSYCAHAARLASFGTPEVLLVGVFVGMLLAPVLEALQSRRFDKLCQEAEGDRSIASAIRSRLDLGCCLVPPSDDELIDASRSYFACRYNDSDVQQFRASKTYGVMYYNLFAAFMLGTLPLLALLWIVPRSAAALVAGALLCALVAHYASTQRFRSSLKQEARYWKGKPASAMLDFPIGRSKHEDRPG